MPWYTRSWRTCVLLAGLLGRSAVIPDFTNDVGQAEFDLYVEQIYGTDRHGNARGLVEVIL